MDGRVPERIRARALRAFWKTNPVLANIDGLDEYCDDYTDAAMVIENLQTIYEVGKGYAEQALDALESLADDEEPADQLAGSEIAAQTETVSSTTRQRKQKSRVMSLIRVGRRKRIRTNRSCSKKTPQRKL